MRTRRFEILFVLILWLAAGCESQDMKDLFGLDGTCPPGVLGCPCNPDFTCDSTLWICLNGTCQNAVDEGEQNQEEETCNPGDTGCVCGSNNTCSHPHDICLVGICVPAGDNDTDDDPDGGIPETCPAGSLSCPCDKGACDYGLYCLDGTCVDGDGYPDGECLPDGTCHGESRCVDGFCVPCYPGTYLCKCDEDAYCDPELQCDLNTCILARCYSPCDADFTDAFGILRRCSLERLTEGCLDGRICVNGTCVIQGDAPKDCSQDLDCPDHQACVGGNCQSQCELDEDCPDDYGCFKKSCKTRCDQETDPCQAMGQHCFLPDGESGYCDHVAPLGETSQTEVIGTYEASPDQVVFYNYNPYGEITIVNDSPEAETFVVRKYDDQVTYEDGSTLTSKALQPGMPCSLMMGTCPMYWLSMACDDEDAVVGTLEIDNPSGQTIVQEMTIEVPGDGGSIVVNLDGADASPGQIWRGRIEITNQAMGKRMIPLSYVESLDGHWQGTMFYFADFGDEGLGDWVEDLQENNGVDETYFDFDKDPVGNALIERWRAFRNEQISYDEFTAILTSTHTASWRWKNLHEDCNEGMDFGATMACYPTDSSQEGYRVYTTDIVSVPIPSGMLDMPIALNLKYDSQENAMHGRIDSAVALQYPGDANVALQFHNDPMICDDTPCLSLFQEMSATVDTGTPVTIAIGGRFGSNSGDSTCRYREGFQQYQVPWLVPGFERETELDSQTQERYRFECRDDRRPYSEDSILGPEMAAVLSTNLSSSNPIPDGNPRIRRLELIDGAMIDRHTMLIFFKEHFDFALYEDPNKHDFMVYGYMSLKKTNHTLGDTDYMGNDPFVDGEFESSWRPSCDEDLLADILNGASQITNAEDAQRVVETIINGYASANLEPDTISKCDTDTDTDSTGECVHYLCRSTGTFDTYKVCPVESEVVFFTVDASENQTLDETCNSQGTCGEVLDNWIDQAEHNAGPIVQSDPIWRCADPNQVICDEDRHDLRNGKTFYASQGDQSETPVLIPIHTLTQRAFRYKTQFVNRQGGNIGFTPDICMPNSDRIRYCYDPGQIEKIRSRLDCLLHIWDSPQELGLHSNQNARAFLEEHLEQSFSYYEGMEGGQPRQHDGFERLYAELLVMLGNDAATKAHAGRFDLAGTQMMPFEGSLFEHDGIDLSGGAGAEMYLLYQAVQYYQEALDRFFAMVPMLWKSPGNAERIINEKTVYWYFDRLLGASVKKIQATREIVKRYQSFNMQDIARRIIERGYSDAYLQSMIFSRFLENISDRVGPEKRAQLKSELVASQGRYRSALLGMYEDYQAITDEVLNFGFPSDYIPFPVFEEGVNPIVGKGFEVLMDRVHQKMVLAKEREENALQSNRQFETDAALFNQELISIKNTYEAQLGNICGYFDGDDGKVYPAISKYAYLEEKARLVGDPCGFMGNGALYEAMAEVDTHGITIKQVIQRHEDILSRVEIEKQRVAKQCNISKDILEYEYRAQGQVNSLQGDIDQEQGAINALQRTFEKASTMAQLAKCSLIVGLADGGDCPSAIAAAAVYGYTALYVEKATINLEKNIRNKQKKIRNIERETAKWKAEKQCDIMQADANARVAEILLELNENGLDALKAQYQLQSMLGHINGLQKKAKRLQLEQDEAEQLAINVEAAKNDPNVRVYRNDAIINAEIAFDDVMKWAFRATRLLEYYKSQTYADKDQLYLIRMISKGEYNLENYLMDLENDWYDFQEEYGQPSQRVAVISLRDHILKIPRYNAQGAVISSGQRIQMMRDELKKPGYLDKKGYLTLVFHTGADYLSPITRNHSILWIEAEVIGSNIGDPLGRLYVNQDGTGVIHSVLDEKTFYRFPANNAVLNPYFNGNRIYHEDTYRNYRLKERPFVNTKWQLVINQRDESVNQDIDLQSLTDIRLYVYYSDLSF